MEEESESPSTSNGIKRRSALVVTKSYAYGVVGQGLVDITGGLSLVQPNTSCAAPPSIGFIGFRNGAAALTGTGTFFRAHLVFCSEVNSLPGVWPSIYQGEVCQTSRWTDNCLYWCSDQKWMFVHNAHRFGWVWH